MEILVLEDDIKRIERFKEKYNKDELFITKNVEKAKVLLRINNYDYIFLDHDLGGEMVDSDNEDTGYQVAKFIVEEQVQKNATIIIHSVNPVGSKKMYDTLIKQGFKVAQLPFTKLLECWL